MNEATLADIRRLFSLVERDVTHTEIEQGASPAITIGIPPGETFSLRGEAYYFLADLSEKVARPGYAAPGLSLAGAHELLIGACARFLSGGPDQAIVWLASKLESTPKSWTVMRPINLTARDIPFTVGNARIQRGPVNGVRDDDNDRLRTDFPAFSISCHVQAWDREAAIHYADRILDEAIAILQLADRHGAAACGLPVVTLSEGRQEHSLSTDRSASVLSSVNTAGELVGTLAALSEAASKQTPTEWEQRTLAAARWVALGIEASGRAMRSYRS